MRKTPMDTKASLQKIYYTTKEVAAMFGITASYLKNLRYLDSGPSYRQVGKLILYSLSDVEAWFEEHAQFVEPGNSR